MKKLITVLIFVLTTCTSIAAQTTAFVNVNLIPMDKERVMPKQTVLVRDGVIIEIGRNLKLPKGCTEKEKTMVAK